MTHYRQVDVSTVSLELTPPEEEPIFLFSVPTLVTVVALRSSIVIQYWLCIYSMKSAMRA